MFPVIAAATLFAAILSEQDDKRSSGYWPLGEGDDDLEPEDVNPDGLSLLQTMEVLSEVPLFVLYLGGDEDYVIEVHADEDVVTSYAEDHHGGEGYEDMVLVRFDRLPVTVFDKLMGHFHRKTGACDDGYGAQGVLAEALAGGATSETIKTYDIHDLPFEDWNDEFKNDYRNDRIHGLTGDPLPAKMVLWTTTSEPEAFEEYIGKPMDKDILSDGIVAVTDRDDVDEYDLKVAEYKPPTHLVKIVVGTKEKPRRVLRARVSDGDDHSIEVLSEILETDVSPDGFDGEDVINALSEFTDGRSLVIQTDTIGGELVFLPPPHFVELDHVLVVESVEPM